MNLDHVLHLFSFIWPLLIIQQSDDTNPKPCRPKGRRRTSPNRKPNRNSKKKRMKEDLTPPAIDPNEIVIGGGAINEKKRNLKNNVRVTDVDVDVNVDRNNYFDPEHIPAHLQHALMGLDRYPNYISRWNYNLLDDVQKLESALENQLEKVRMQKRQLLLRNEHVRSILQTEEQAVVVADAGADIDKDKDTIADADAANNIVTENTNPVDWSILRPPTTWQEVRDVLHPRASDAIFKSKMFLNEKKRQVGHNSRKNNTSKSNNTPSITVKDVLDGKVAVDLDAGQLEGWLDEEMFDVYSFPLLSETFCIRLKNTLQNLIHLSETKTPTTSTLSPLGSRPIDLDTIGASWINNLLFHLILRPLSKHLFATSERIANGDLDWRQGYVAGYSHNPTGAVGVQRQRLVPHTDDSEVTLNVGLATGGGVDYEGGDLVFWGLRGTRTEGELNGRCTPMIGKALIHSGRHLHEVEEVTSNGIDEVDSKGGGGRFAFVIWARSWKGLREGICPCCWLNRRLDDGKGRTNGCMCGSKWS